MIVSFWLQKMTTRSSTALPKSAFHVISHGINSSASAQSEICRLTIGNVRRAVKRAWIEILGIPTFAANRPWSEAGGDSLDLLRLWFRIENTLGRCLSMEAMHRNITPEQIIEVIERLLDVSSEKPAASVATPVVFFMPPADGDLPQHARFRAARENKIWFVVIRYPTWQEIWPLEGSLRRVFALRYHK